MYKVLSLAIAALGALTNLSAQTEPDQDHTDAATTSASQAPNIVWIYIEDLSPWLPQWGDNTLEEKVNTWEQLSQRGTTYTRTYMPAPVCSATRSALITGAMQTTSGTHNHRSSRGPDEAIHLPEGWSTLPQILQQQGYATGNFGKTDYNFQFDDSNLYTLPTQRRSFPAFDQGELDQHHPYFIQFQLAGGKARPVRGQGSIQGEDMSVPAYFPDTPIQRNNWAHHYNTIIRTDRDIRRILNQLEQNGSTPQNTYLFVFSDHGNNYSLRHKQFCYEGGVHVPLIIIGPDVPAGEVNNDLVSGLDISATTLALAGADIPDYVQGQDLFSADYQARDHVISARDRCDYTIDTIRTVRTEHHRFIQNYKLDRPLMQPQYRDRNREMRELRRMHADGELSDYQDQHLFGTPRPQYELYDLRTDPHQLNNLANDPEHAETLQTHINLLLAHQQQYGDLGMQPEPTDTLRASYNRWRNRAVNPEYDQFRDNQASEESQESAE